MQNIVPFTKFAFTKKYPELKERGLYHNMIFGNPQYILNKKMDIEGGNIEFLFEEKRFKIFPKWSLNLFISRCYGFIRKLKKIFEIVQFFKI